ncbi:MAG: hypothetical protein OEU94_05500 [Aquincola sp.]|nr:hypothetical protein [Aquincola sp.]MDH4289530.1 hypothetical protein [Aquincola sp.]
MHTKTSALERATSIVLRTLHLVAVVALGAALLGAPMSVGASGAAAVGSGALLFAMELFARRLHAFDLAGLTVLLKLVVVAVVAGWPGAATHGLAAFWMLVALSSLSSHAPKPVRHWWPWTARRRGGGQGARGT